MSFIDRIVQFPGRITLTNVNDGTSETYDVERAEGTVTTEGTLLNAANLNDQVTNRYEATMDVSGATTPDDNDLLDAVEAAGWTADVIASGAVKLKKLLAKIINKINTKEYAVVSDTVTIPANRTSTVGMANPFNNANVAAFVSLRYSSAILQHGNLAFFISNITAANIVINFCNNSTTQLNNVIVETLIIKK